MHIGVLYEGKLDQEPLQILIESILHQQNPDLEIRFVNHSALGPITSAMAVAVALFFEGLPMCDIAVFFSDHDRDGEKCKAVRDWVRDSFIQVSNNIIAIACPDPNFETWLIEEDIAIRHVLEGLGYDNPLPYDDLKPKDRLQKIIDQYNQGDVTRRPLDVYIEIAKKINIDMLSGKNAAFKKFVDELLDISIPVLRNIL